MWICLGEMITKNGYFHTWYLNINVRQSAPNIVLLNLEYFSNIVIASVFKLSIYKKKGGNVSLNIGKFEFWLNKLVMLFSHIKLYQWKFQLIIFIYAWNKLPICTITNFGWISSLKYYWKGVIIKLELSNNYNNKKHSSYV